ncbi:hypothetical protein MUN88_10795 [Gracilibacillus caseinilyticus]|uniref:Heparan-alpha-glucosaminide N-acetyltransferase catalytic domain-containing protein n=1 Tax=Gracilibacillus caseinilyticus TaxID=2932256 RepID=A0ABY4ERJ0_9BACI|nr:hypothetical protein [Gracilibacillus caseinilyticus]UOQ46595.1 hypothetical protein MUN88_10795 [Gracilibacillus caseinilyticus]
MVYAHVLQFFSDTTLYPSTSIITSFFNLITFSGFVFCFGYVGQLAYYRKPFASVYKKMLMTGLKTLLAFYLSGIAFQLYVGEQPLNLDTIWPIVLLQVIPGWSEFLIAFALIIVFGVILFHGFRSLSKRPVLLWATAAILLLATWIDHSEIKSVYMGLLIGTDQFPTFPVLPYMPFYLIGIYFAKYRIGFRWKYLLFSMLGTSLFVYYLASHDFQLPDRFPPTVYWITGSTFFLYIYYLISKSMDKWSVRLKYLRIIGENTLFYLLISNMFIFSLDHAMPLLMTGPLSGFFFAVVILGIITFMVRIVTVSSAEK